MARGARVQFAPQSVAVGPIAGMKVVVLCQIHAFEGQRRRTGTVVETGTGRYGDGFVVRFESGYCEAFREIDIRIGLVQLLAADPRQARAS